MSSQYNKIGSFNNKIGSCSFCEAGTYTSLSQIPTLPIEFSFDLGTVSNTGVISNGGSLTSVTATLHYANISAKVFDMNAKVGTGCAVFLADDDTVFSQYVQISPFETTDSGLSFALWFLNDESSTWARLFDFGFGEAADNILMFIHHSNLALGVYIGNVASNQPLNVVTNVNDGEWRHVVWTFRCMENIYEW